MAACAAMIEGVHPAGWASPGADVVVASASKLAAMMVPARQMSQSSIEAVGMVGAGAEAPIRCRWRHDDGVAPRTDLVERHPEVSTRIQRTGCWCRHVAGRRRHGEGVELRKDSEDLIHASLEGGGGERLVAHGCSEDDGGLVAMRRKERGGDC